MKMNDRKKDKDLIKNGMRDRILSLVLVLTLIISLFSGLSFMETKDVLADDDGTITYTIDENTEIKYYPNRGEYGTIEYKKSHYTTSSTIRYYTQKFVITMDKKTDSDNLNLTDDATTRVLTVSMDGAKHYINDADTSQKFYWYDDKVPNEKGYITTTYVIDGSYFHDIMENALTQGKSGTIYIHHVFAIVGGDIPMAGGGHTTQHKPFYTYDELFKVNGWNNNRSTWDSQEKCLNVPVPYTRDIPVITTYFDDDGNTVRATRETKKFNEIWNSSVPSEVTDFYGNTYKVKQSNSFYGPMYVWFKKTFNMVGSGASDTVNDEITNFVGSSFKTIRSAMASDFSGAYGSLDPAGKAKNINKDTSKPGTFTEGEVNTFTFDLSNLGNTKTAWAIQLYVPVSNKKTDTSTYLHFFDPSTGKAVGTSSKEADGLKTGSAYTFTSVDGKLSKAGIVDTYEFDYDNKNSAFWLSSDSDETIYDYEVAKKQTRKTGTWSNTDYKVSSLGEKKYNVLWAPVKKKDTTKKYSEVTYGYYDVDSGLRLAAPTAASPSQAAYGSSQTFSGITCPADYVFAVSSSYPAFYAASDASTDTTKYANAKNNRILDGTFNQTEGTFAISRMPSKKYTTIWIPVKKSTPPPTPTPPGRERTDVIIEYIDSTTGKVVGSSEDESAVRGSLITPKAPSGYEIDTEGKKTPLAVSKTGIDRVTLTYDKAQTATDHKNVSFVNKNKCTFNVPTGTANKIAVKAFVPVKLVSRQTQVYLKYCITDTTGKVRTISDAYAKGYADFNSEFKVTGIEKYVSYNGKTYEVQGLSSIYYGNGKTKLVAQQCTDVLNMAIDGTEVMGKVTGGTMSSDKTSATFATASKGDYHVVYVYCSEVYADTKLTIHYIDAYTGEELYTKTDLAQLRDAYEIWTGIDGKLSFGLTLKIDDSITSEGKEYIPVYLSDDESIVTKTDHTKCTKGTKEFQYIDSSGGAYVSRKGIYCSECGRLLRVEELDRYGTYKTIKDNDGNDFGSAYHKYSTYTYDTPYKTRYAGVEVTSTSHIMSYDETYSRCANASFSVSSSGSLSLTLKRNNYDYQLEENLIGPFSALPYRKTALTAAVLYVPCVEAGTDVTVRYITVKENGKKDKEVLTVDGGSAEKNKKYSYTGDTTITGTDGKTYTVIGSGDALAYGSTNYITARDDTTNTKGQPVTFDGKDTWTTKKKYTSSEDGTLYIPVKEVKPITVTVEYITLKDDGKKDTTITTVPAPDAEKDKKYKYQGSSVVEKGGKTYIVTGEGDNASYDDYTYEQGKNGGKKGTDVDFDGTDTWTTTTKTPDGIEKITIYIPVKEAKYEVKTPDPEGDITVSHMDPGASAVINAKKGTPFDVSTAIPSSEYIYSKVTARSYLVSAGFRNMTGLLDAEITVELPYVLYTKDKDGNIIDSLTKRDKKTRKVTVSAPYSYWVLNSSALYSAATGTVKNDSAEKNMKASFSPSVPSFDNNLSNNLADHVRFRTEVPTTVTMPEVVVYGTEESAPVAPTLQKELAQAFAATKLPDVEVKNDSVKFNGNVVLKSAWTSVKNVTKPDVSKIPEAGKISSESADTQIPAEKANVKYASTGTMKYTLVSKKGSADASLTFDITGINAVNVHTPVVSYLTLENDNLKYVQSVDADETKVHLVVGRSEQADSAGQENSSNDFTIKVKNTGKHISAPGYGTLDTTKYILRQEVMFTFDVFADRGTNGKEDDDELIKANTWTEFDVKDTFYLPEWVAEGNYIAKVRTIAINGADNITSEQKNANTTQTKYVAYDKVDVVVSGKMYGLTITSVNSTHADWKDVFVTGSKIKNAYPETYTTDGTLKSITKFNKNYRYYYMSGLNNELGIAMASRNSRYIFPILNGSSPAAEGTGLLKSGYTWNFRLQTEGTRTSVEKSAVVIIPSFYWISADGKTRERVDVWYSDKVDGKTQNFIRFGDAVDAKNTHIDYAASATMGIPSAEITLLNALNGSKDRTTKNVNAYTYGEIKNNGYLRTFTGTSYADRMIARRIIASSKKNVASVYEQTWYFEYSLPNTWHACAYGYDLAAYIQKAGGCNYKEDFWKKDGYLVVHFDIGAYDETGLIMTYANSAENVTKGMCDMWATEGYVTDRTDAKGVNFKFTEGDVFVVGIGKNTTAADDYAIDHLN